MSVYKSEKSAYLNRSLQSVWDDQTLKPDEIILVEDGPLGDDLHEVISSWKSKLGERLNVLVNEQNLGLTKSLNKGIEVAKSEFIARMDSDDISLPQRFEKQIAFMKTHPECDVLGGGLIEIDESDKEHARRLYPLSCDNIKKYIVKANPLAHPTVMIRKKVFEDGHRYDEKYRKNQDLNLWFRLLKSGYILNNIDDNILLFRRTSDTYTKRSSRLSLNTEFNIYINGIRELYGPITWRYVYPIIRYTVKIMPSWVNVFVYKYLFKKENK
jgi:glycosyltransferase involved in cell wall biosynthesis